MTKFLTNKKSGQAFPISGKKSSSLKGSPTSHGKKLSDNKPELKLGKDYHIYRVFQFRSDDGNSDRDEIAHVKARDIDDVIQFIKLKYVKPEFVSEMETDGYSEEDATISSSYALDENGDEIKEIPDGEEDDVYWVTEGWQVEQNDDESENFETIFGGNDSYDITESVNKPKTKGLSSEEAIKHHGGVAPAMFFGLNRINQKVHDDAIREKYRKLIDAINDEPIPEKAKRVLISELEAKMKDEMRNVGRVEAGEINLEKGKFDEGKDYGSGYGVR